MYRKQLDASVGGALAVNTVLAVVHIIRIRAVVRLGVEVEVISIETKTQVWEFRAQSWPGVLETLP